MSSNNFSFPEINSNINSSNATTNNLPLLLLMAHYDFWDKPGKLLGFSDVKENLFALKDVVLQQELNDVISILIERLDVNEFAMPLVGNTIVDHSPLKMHVRYPKEHILVAFGDSTFTKKSSSREGVLTIANANTELLFVTLNKCEKQFSTTTMYHDYAISPTLFHWQTQNSAKPSSGKGLSYIQQKKLTRLFYFLYVSKAKMKTGEPWAL